jgi:hypothetical protein
MLLRAKARAKPAMSGKHRSRIARAESGLRAGAGLQAPSQWRIVFNGAATSRDEKSGSCPSAQFMAQDARRDDRSVSRSASWPRRTHSILLTRIIVLR